MLGVEIFQLRIITDYLFLEFFMSSVVLVVAIVGLTKSNLPADWDPHTAAGNGTDDGEDHAMAAIGQYASNLDTVAVDKSGRGKHKWYNEEICK